MKSLMAVEHIGYRIYLANRVSDHGRYSRDARLVHFNLPWLVAACFPLAYLTKSLQAPLFFLNVSLYTLLYTDLTIRDCYYCRPSVRDLAAVVTNNGVITLSEMN